MAVSLQPITFTNVRSIIALQVSDAQTPYVAPNAVSIAEGLLNPGGWLRAVMLDTPVGFVMLFNPRVAGAIARHPTPSNSLFLWRMMIDAAHQRHGFGRQTLDLVADHARASGVTRLLVSFVPGPDGPEPFYRRYGFVPNGRMRGEQPELELALR